MSEPVGFIGLGLMGSAIASRLMTAGPVVVWNRTHAASEPFARAGATVAASAADALRSSWTVFIMVTDERAIDDILGFDEALLRGRTIVQMSTVPPGYSASLAQHVAEAGGRYVEAPVSGSRQPALNGQLVGMIAGADDAALDDATALLQPVCASVFRCGRPPQAMQMKLAVNTFLITLVTGLAETFHFAEEHGLRSDLLAEILGAGSMASSVSRAKAAALVATDFPPQAAIPDVLKNANLVVDPAREHQTETVLMVASAQLYAEALELGHGDEDMAAVIAAYRARTARLHR